MDVNTLKRLMHYDPDTGVVRWKMSVANRIKPGDIAGWRCKGKEGKTYMRVESQGETYSIHRLIWLYMTGDWPKGQIDHIDGNGLNNEWGNLRDVPQSENVKNARLRHDNTSGVTGVTWHKRDKQWEVYINHNRKRHYLGKYDSLDEAVNVRKKAELDYGFHSNHGSVRPL